MSLQVDIERDLGHFTLRSRFESEGGVTGLLGASGCGKSFTLKCIAGIEKPDRGRIVLDGVTLFDSSRRINLKPQQRHVGYLFQNYALFPNMTVRQNILCGLHGEKSAARRREICDEVLHLFQLEELVNHKPHQLSGGQAQRVALARIMVSRPKLLMLDEPFPALDSHLRMRLQLELLGTLKDFSGDVLMVTHSRDEAYHMCDRIAIMDRGQLYPPRDTKGLFADPQTAVAATLTGCKNMASARKAGESELFVPEWGVTLTTALPLRDDVNGVAIRAHYFNPKEARNAFPVRFEEDMEEPFEWVIRFRYAGQTPDSENVWWRLPKEKWSGAMPKTLGIAPVNVLPLYPTLDGR